MPISRDRSSLPQRLKILLLGLFVVASSASHARCAYNPQTVGFLHETQHLPANAKGVLFVYPAGYRYQLRSRALKDFELVIDLPPALQPQDFLITERSTGKKLSPVLTPISLSEVLGQPQRKRFATRDKHLNKCAAENIASLDGCMELERNVSQLIKDGVLFDAGEELKKRSGMFRISATEGLKPGEAYDVRFSRREPHVESIQRELRLTIDTAPLPIIAGSELAVDVRAFEQPLPSNTDGLLVNFGAPDHLDYRLRQAEPLVGGYLLAERPAPIRAEDFSIRDVGSGKILTSVLKRLPQEQQGWSQTSRLYAAKDPRLNQCLKEATIKGGVCPDVEGKAGRLLEQGAIYDATAEVLSAFGMFRVSAAEGLVPGKRYDVMYAGQRLGFNHYRTPVHVIINQTPQGTENHGIWLNNGIVQYRLPSALAPYRDYLHFYTEILGYDVRPQGLALDTVRSIESERHTGQDCGGPSALGRERTWGEYSTQLIPQCHQAKGRVGFLELDDRIFDTPLLRVNCP